MRNVRVLARGAMRALRLDENVPPEVAEALGELAAAVRALGDALEDGRGLRGGARARRPRGGDRHPRAGGHDEPVRRVIVGQIRSTATDLLAGTGMSYEEATEAVRDAVREGG